MLLEEKLRLYETVNGKHCPDCGNPWWFRIITEDKAEYECTTCAWVVNDITEVE